jgi:thymidine kinase
MMGRSLQLILGPMFAGKTKGLILRYRGCRDLGIKCVILKPLCDNRYGLSMVGTHDGIKEPALAVAPGDVSLLRLLEPYKVIFIDEIQFFPLVDILAILLHDKIVIGAGLSADFRDTQWPTVAGLLPYATKLKMLKAQCSKCKQYECATLTRRKDELNSDLILIGGDDEYEAVCFDCLYEIPILK